MANILFHELGLPIELINPRMVTVRGELVPDVNLVTLQRAVFDLLVRKPTRLTGAEVRFIRKHLRLRQADLAQELNLANHSVVSQWESREAEATGMDYNTEVVLRLRMAIRGGHPEQVVRLLEQELRALQAATSQPLRVPVDMAA